MKQYLKLMRIKHYIKNLFIFVPLIFSYSFVDYDKVLCALIAFVQFSVVSSIVYIINDITDIEKDRLHPTKRNRPLAAGAISIRNAQILVVVLALAFVGLLVLSSNWLSGLIIAVYFIMNLSYSFYLKNIALVDVFIIAVGFILRIYAGAFAIDVPVSYWLLLTTFAISLFLGFGKRYGEKRRSEANESRAVLSAYSLSQLHTFMTISITLTVVFYALYCTISDSILGSYGFLTIPFVVFAIFRYFMILDNDDVDGDPTDVLLNDNIIKICILLYCVTVAVLIILNK